MVQRMPGKTASALKLAMHQYQVTWMQHGVMALCLSYTEAVDCVAAGFAPSLRCGSCATLEALVPDEEIVKDCRSCCADDDKVTYVKARLEVCE